MVKVFFIGDLNLFEVKAAAPPYRHGIVQLYFQEYDMLRTKIRRYLRHGTLRQLSVFQAVARLGSFTRAAEALHMAQPTVSVQIKKLSESVGLPLFEQAGRKIQLTAAGLALEDACLELFGTLSRLEDNLADIRCLHTRPAAAQESNPGPLAAHGK